MVRRGGGQGRVPKSRSASSNSRAGTQRLALRENPLFGFHSSGHFLIEMNDGQLLRRFALEGDDSAFRELAQRHLGLVHATATRRMGDTHAAADVSQAVFCLLVRKARGLFEVADLGGWLHRATCWKASEYERAERRRRAREQVSTTWNPDMNSATPDEVWKELAPILDVCLDRLDDADREILLARFYRRRALREIGVELRLTEDAARMRVQRALERLRRLLVTSGASALTGMAATIPGGVSLEDLLSERLAMPTPSDLATRVFAAASGVTLESGWLAGVGLSHGLRGLGWRGASWAGAGLLVAGWVVLRLGQAGPDSASATPEAAAPERLATAATEVVAAASAASARSESMEFRVGEPADLEARLAPLWSILKSAVPDLSNPPQDLRDCIANLADQPEAVFDALSWAIEDPLSTLATRERAIWGLWLLGGGAPAWVPRIVTLAVDLVTLGEPRDVRWHAAEVLIHLSIPEGSVGSMGVALQARPDAWAATVRFWESAARQRLEEVREVVSPWRGRSDGLGFLAATSLARLPNPAAQELAPILLESISDGERQEAALRALAALGTSAHGLAPQLAERIREVKQPGQSTLRQRLIEVLAEIAPESRKEWPEVDVYLTRKEEVETLERKLSSNTASVEDLVNGLKRNETSWRAALALESLGSRAAEALPALRQALEVPDCPHAQYFANAIKAIDPASPKPRFERDDLLGALRALAEASKEVADSVPTEERDELATFIEKAGPLAPEQLADRAEALGRIDPRLRRTWVRELIRVDPALAGLLSE